MSKVGDRVGAIRNATCSDVFLYGYGVYSGDEETDLGFPSPKITLDNGKVVYGYQCWWAPEEQIKKLIGSKKVTIVNP